MNLRRVIFALAVLSLFVGMASAQTIQVGALNCTIQASNPNLRAESKFELAGDVLVQCSGGNPPAVQTNQVPAVDITVNYGVPVVSRQAANAASNATYTDALLLIDDPQSTTSPVAPGYGSGGAISVCTPSLPGPGGSSGNPACSTFSYYTPGNPSATNGYYVGASTAAGGTTSANAYQGVLTSANQVTFYGVPLVAPVTQGVLRQFRITNVRVAPTGSSVQATVTFGGPNTGLVPVTGATTVTAGTVATGFTYGLGNASGVGNAATFFSACLPPSALGVAAGTPPPYVALLNFASTFSGAAKPIAAPVPTTAASPYPLTLPTPLYKYGSTSYESGILVTGLSAIASATGTNAAIGGAADAGTRFKAVFSGLPTGKNAQKVSVYVSLYNVASFVGDGSGGTANGNTKTDGTGVAAPAGSGGNVAQLSVGTGTTALSNLAEAAAFVPATGITGAVNGVSGLAAPATNDPVAIPLTVDSNGNATAIWEVLKNSGKTNFQFAVYIAYGTAASPTTTPTVTLSLAPVAATATSAVQIPDFSPSPVTLPLFNITPCQTALLFPFVTTAVVSTTQHWDTGIAIANTGADPWNTVVAPTTPSTSSTCSLSFFGPSAPPAITGPAIAPGGTWAFVASDPANSGTPHLGFSGYMFAVCNFLYAHGFAYVLSDNTMQSPSGTAMGYLALVVNNSSPIKRATALSGEDLSQ